MIPTGMPSPKTPNDDVNTGTVSDPLPTGANADTDNTNGGCNPRDTGSGNVNQAPDCTKPIVRGLAGKRRQMQVKAKSASPSAGGPVELQAVSKKKSEAMSTANANGARLTGGLGKIYQKQDVQNLNAQSNLAPYWENPSAPSQELPVRTTDPNAGTNLAPYWDNPSGENQGENQGVMPLPTTSNDPQPPPPPGAVAIAGVDYGRMAQRNSNEASVDTASDVEQQRPGAGADGLVEARPVDASGESFPQAQEVRPSRINTAQEKDQHRNAVMCLGFVLVSALVVAIGLGVGLQKDDSKAVVAQTPAPTTSVAPSGSPSSAPTGPLETLLSTLPEYTQESLEVFDSPQWKAWDWLSKHPDISSMPQWKMTQLFALATFFYTSGGHRWREDVRKDWLLYDVDECDWFSSHYGLFERETAGFSWSEEARGACNEAGQFHSLYLSNIGSIEGEDYTVVIPPEIELLTSLTFFGLEMDRQGDLPLRDPERAGGLLGDVLSRLYNFKNLTGLTLCCNGLSGPIPTELATMTNLGALYFSKNSFSGAMPTELATMTKLTYLNFWQNYLSGPIPSELGLLTEIESIDLGRNAFSGTIPTEIGSCNQVDRFLVGNNNLSGAIPSEIGRCSQLETFDVHDNALTGTIPSELFSLKRLQDFFLETNVLSGTIPTEFGIMTSLERVGLMSNMFSGTTPSEIGLLRELQQWGTMANPLSGGIPTEIGMLSSAHSFLFAYNGLTGNIPSEFGILPFLAAMSLDVNSLTGTIPVELAQSTALNALSLMGNGLTGPIPSVFGRVPNLQGLYLGYTGLSGSIPSQLGLLHQLGVLDLSNMPLLSGSIPGEVSELNLIELVLSGSSQLSGTISEKHCKIGSGSCDVDYWWTEFRKVNCVLEFDCTDLLCGCDCPCANSTMGG